MRYTLFSGGEGSFRAEMIDRAQHPHAERRLVFTDTLYEDADTYRFLCEAASHAFGRSADWVPSADEFPDYRVAGEFAIEDYSGNPEWRAFLAALRERAAVEIPELIWLVEGRDPWEVFRDRAFLGNSQRDPCSDILKRRMTQRWRDANCDKANDTFAVGIGDHEPHRYDDGEGHGIRPQMAKKGWNYIAPLLTYAGEHGALFFGRCEDIGVRPGRNYALGYVHDNCGGFCSKAGHAHNANRFRVQPERAAYDAMMERKIIAHVGGGVAMMTDRAGRKKVPLTLDDLHARLRRQPDLIFEYEPGSSGCGCMMDKAA